MNATQQQTGPMKFQIGSLELTAIEVLARAPKDHRPRPQGPESFHRGWRVVGVSPEAVAAALAQRALEIKNAEERNAQIAAGKSRLPRTTVPALLVTADWIAKAPLKPARAKNFEILSSAEQCMALALKSGWCRLEMREIKKGKS